MEKSPDAFRTISEVAEALDTPAHVLRFWETRFPQIRPVKRAGGRRYYRPADIALLHGIRKLLHDDGLTIRGVQKILREQGVRHVMGLGGSDPKTMLPAEDAPWIDTGPPPEPGIVLPFARDSRPSGPGADAAPPPELTVEPVEETIEDWDAVERIAVPGADDGDGDGALWPDAGMAPIDDDGLAALTGAEPDAAEASLRLSATDPDAASAAEPEPPLADAPVLRGSVWRSIPLAPGEDVPLAARLRALPRGALRDRTAEVEVLMARARALRDRMSQPPAPGRP